MTVITGGTGFIGAHLIEMLVSMGEVVRALVRRQTSLPHGAESVHCDLADGNGLQDAVRGADTVIHLAGVTKANRSQDYYTGNTKATENLARVLSGSPARFVHVSSLAAIGPSLDGKPVNEETEPHPLTHYGRSKLEAERAVQHFTPNAVIVRPPVVYGPRDTDVFQLLRSISKGLVVEIAGGERWFSAIYVKDLCQGLLAAARGPKAAGRAYFLAHAQALSWTQFGAAAARVMGKSPRVLKVPLPLAYAAAACAEIQARFTGKPGIISREKIREARCMAWTCETRRASEELGFTATTSIEAGLDESIAWYKRAGWLV
jgi:nucleoside-diphosphate-sugar epimerase